MPFGGLHLIGDRRRRWLLAARRSPEACKRSPEACKRLHVPPLPPLPAPCRVVYPTSALHKASNGGQHAYITHEGAAEPSSASQRPASAAAAAVLASPSSSPLPLPTPPPSSPSTLAPNHQGPAPEWGGELYPLTATAPGLDPGSGQGPSPLGPSRGVFEAPLLPPTPADTSYAFSGQQRVPLWRAASGHLLVCGLEGGTGRGEPVTVNVNGDQCALLRAAIVTVRTG